MRDVIRSIEGEFRRYQAIGDAAMAQLSDDDLKRADGNTNSITAIARHIAGNFISRFTDFLTTDGEKDWRDREGEFFDPCLERGELEAFWERGWAVLFDTLSELEDDDLSRTIRIRDVESMVLDALTRSVAHASYHVGQIVYVAKRLKGDAWTYLSIPPGESDSYRLSAGRESPVAHAERLRKPVGE
jgi:hypothetical protein